MLLRNLLFVIVNIYLVSCDNLTDSSMKLVIDNDAGGDDAMAIVLALLYEKHRNGPKLIGLTTVNGNTAEDNVCINNQRILKLAKRQDVPIYRGSKSSLVTTPKVDDFFGKDGLGDSGEPLTDLVPAHTQHAVDALIELSKIHQGQLIVLTIGALTNVALALKTDPDFINRIAHLYVGAGNIYSESNPDAEFNAHMDAEAYRVVAQYSTPDKVTILPFSQVKQYCNFSLEWRRKVLGRIDTDFMKALNIYERIALENEKQWHALDPAAFIVIVRPDLVDEFKYSKNDIILCGEKRGIVTNEFVDKEEANARVVYSFKREEYEKFILDIFALE